MGLMDRRNLVYVLKFKTHTEFKDDPYKSIQDWINLADKRGDEVFELQTHDGFTIFKRFYSEKTDGSKELVSQLRLKENELTPKEAIEAMLNKERLIDFENPADIAEYRWDGEYFIRQDGYTCKWKIVFEFTGLQRKNESAKLQDTEREKIRVRETLGFDLDLSKLPQVRSRYGMKGAMLQAISICEAQKLEITQTHVHSALAFLESDLEGMFPSALESGVEHKTMKTPRKKSSPRQTKKHDA